MGQSTFGVDDLALTLLLFAPGESGDSREFRTLATLQSTTMNLVLSPGERSSVIRFAADDVNPDLMKEFLASPSSMVLRPTSFGLTNANGVDFDFITETTASQTALVEIKFGPEDFQTYRVATNVQRTSSGALAGVRMEDVMETLGYTLGSGYTTEEQFTTDSSGNSVSNGFVLTGLAGRAYQVDNGFPVAFWIVNRKSEDGARIGGALPNFGDITLLPGEEIQLTYVLDLDKDGLSDSLETFFATASGITDTDADGLDDYEEVITGVMAGADSMGNAIMGLQVYGYPKRVFTNPRLADSDSDGLSDAAEKALGSDPLHPDTDRDGILDGPDPCPLSASRTLFVNSDPAFGSPAGPGASWATAYLHLQDALSVARLANGNADCADDVSEIWVARGVYRADGGIGGNGGSLMQNASFVLDMDIEIYGGFSGLGFELKREQRDSNPASNGTELSGDLLNDDSLGANRSDNTNTIVVTGQKTVVTLDGFTISGGSNQNASGGGLLANDCTGTWRNINFFENSSVVSGGAVFIGLGTNRIEECSFTANDAWLGGGALDANAPRLLEIVDCTFTDNIAQISPGGGAILVTNGGDLLIDQSVFSGNKADAAEGGAIYVLRARMMVSKCTFQANTARFRGGAISSRVNASVNVVNCRIASNELFDGDSRGSGLYNERRAGALMNVINCTIDGNRSNTSGIETFVAYPHGALYGATTVKNSLIFNNDRITGWDGNGNGGGGCGTGKVGGFVLANDQVAQINDVLDGAVNHCFIQNLGVRIETGQWTFCSNDATWNPYQGDNNLGFATFTDSTNRSQAGSPITATGELMDGSIGIDAGTNTVDIDLNTPGTQFLPPADLDGKPRQVDGDNNGTSIVDTGAFEYQGS